MSPLSFLEKKGPEPFVLLLREGVCKPEREPLTGTKSFGSLILNSQPPEV